MDFNGDCVLGFKYRRTENGVWKLAEPPRLDARVMEKIKLQIGHGLYVDLPRIANEANEWLPHAHEGLLLRVLGEVKLDGGSIRKRMGDGVCIVEIVVGNRSSGIRVQNEVR